MKKLLFVITAAAAFCALCAPTYADEIIGAVYATDIGALIDKQPIASYNVNDSTYVIAEELRDYGFDVVWDGQTMTLTVDKNDEVPRTNLDPDEINVKKSYGHEKLYDVYSTDIKTYINGEEVSSSFINGRMLVKLRDLGVFGEVTFDNEKRTAELDTIKFRLEQKWDAANKETLQINDWTVYEGEVENGKPNGIGKMTVTSTVRKSDFEYVYNYGYGSVGAPSLVPMDNETSEEQCIYLGSFKNGQEVGMVYSEGVIEKTFYFSNGAALIEEHNEGAAGFFDSVEKKEVYVYSGNAVGPLCGEYIADHPDASSSSMGSITSSLIVNREVMSKCGGSVRYSSVYNDYSGVSDIYYNIPNNEYLFGYEIIYPSEVIVPLKNVRFKEVIAGGILDENNNLYPTSMRGSDGQKLKTYEYARKNIKAIADAYTMDASVVLAQDGKVYRINDVFDDSQDTLLLENIKAVTHNYYLTNDGVLYYTDYDEMYQEAAENVAELRSDNVDNGKSWYLTEDGRLFLANRGESKLVSENVEAFSVSGDSQAAYITDMKEVYYYNGYEGETKFIGSGAVACHIKRGKVSYINEAGEAYSTASVYSNRKIADDCAAVVTGSNGGVLLLKNDGSAYLYKESDLIKIGENISAIFEGMYTLDYSGTLQKVNDSDDSIKKYGYTQQFFAGRRVTMQNE